MKLRLVALALAAAGLASRGHACQNPPEVPCAIVPERASAIPGQPFRVTVTVTNLSPTGIQDDLPWTIEVTANDDGALRRGRCWPGSRSAPVMPSSVGVVLDDAASAAPDDPTSWTGTFTILPAPDATALWIVLRACGGGTGLDTCLRSCAETLCIPVRDEDGPHVVVLDPVVAEGEAGGSVGFDFRVEGADPARPLSLVLSRTNPDDPLDLFPIEPAALLGSGVLVDPASPVTHASCGLHGPCFQGVLNQMHATLIDASGAIAWDSRAIAPGGIAVAKVTEARLARLERTAVVGEHGDGTISACESGDVFLRLNARNAALDADLEDVVLELPLPPGAVVAGYSLHYHDNPMDAVTPPASDLVAGGTLTAGPGILRIDVGTIETRLRRYVSPAPVFRDCFEADIHLSIPEGAADPLTFGGLRATAVAAGRAIADERAPWLVPVGAPEPPLPARSLRVLPDARTITWTMPGASETSRLHRGEIRELRPGLYGRCLARGLTTPSWIDDEPVADGGWFYLAVAEECGLTGSAGTDSLGRPRALLDPCR